MKSRLLLLFVLAAAGAVQAQEAESAPAKPKTLVFPPAAEVPEKPKASTPAPKKGAPVPKGGTPVPKASTPAPVPVAPSESPLPAPPAVSKQPIDPSAGSAPDQLATNFFSLLQRGELDRAYEVLTKGSKISERSEELKALKVKTKEAIDVFGPVLGFEQVEVKPIGDRLLRKTYVSLGRDFPLRWRLYFYNPDITWRLIDLRVDDRLSGMFDEPDEQRQNPDSRP